MTPRDSEGVEPAPDQQIIRGRALQLPSQRGQVFALGSAEGAGLDLPAALSLAAGADPAPA